MRKMIIALTAVFLAPTAVLASVAREDSGLGAAATTVFQSQDVLGGGRVAIGKRGSSGDSLILAKGDMSGNGPGAGGQKGQKKGGHKGKQAEGKDNPGKAKGKGKS